MKYISHYQSPLGNILLAADEQGLTGLWFEGQKYYSQKLNIGLISTFLDKNPLLLYLFISLELIFKKRYGKSFALFPMAVILHISRLLIILPQKED